MFLPELMLPNTHKIVNYKIILTSLFLHDYLFCQSLKTFNITYEKFVCKILKQLNFNKGTINNLNFAHVHCADFSPHAVCLLFKHSV